MIDKLFTFRLPVHFNIGWEKSIFVIYRQFQLLVGERRVQQIMFLFFLIYFQFHVCKERERKIQVNEIEN